MTLVGWGHLNKMDLKGMIDVVMITITMMDQLMIGTFNEVIATTMVKMPATRWRATTW